MLRFLKILFYVILSVSLLLAAGYTLYKDVLFEEARIFLKNELSRSLDLTIDIGAVSYVPFQSIALKDVSILTKQKPVRSIGTINNVVLTLDIPSFIREKKLKVAAELNVLSMENYSASAAIHIESKKAIDYKSVLDPSLIEQITLIDGTFKQQEFFLEDIDGILDIKSMTISDGKVSLSYKNKPYYLTFLKLNDYDFGYDVSITSKNLDIDTKLIKEDKDLTIDSLVGNIFGIIFDAKGRINNFLDPEAECTLSGAFEAKLKSLGSIPGEIGNFIKTNPISGNLKSNVFITGPIGKIHDLEANSTVYLKNLKTDGLLINEIMGKFNLSKGIITCPLLNGSLYGGTVTGACDIDITEKNLPFGLSLVLNNINFNYLLSSLTKEKSRAYGTLNTELSLKGNIINDSTYKGVGYIMIVDGDLGPMPILTPFLGKTYMIIKHIFPAMQKIDMRNAYTDFYIQDRKIFTDNLTLWGESMSITAKGYMDFDGNLDFFVENQFLQQDVTPTENWQTALQGAITNFGKFISKAYLRGSIKEPKWKFEYKNPFKSLLPIL